MMTEEEAKTKWCPHVRVSGAGSIDGTEWLTNREDDGPDDLQFMNCVGSACMAWRWARVANPDFKERAIQQRWPEPPDTRKPHEKERFVTSETEGFCGLAGSPS